jgi:tetratricopeptide (TPR) repeat protein
MLHSLAMWFRPAQLALLSLALTAFACGHGPPPVNQKAVKFQAEGARAYVAGDLDRAAGLFSLALEYDPRMAEARSGMGLVAFARGDKDAAEKHFKAALALNEELAEAHLNLGTIYFERDELDEAMTRFRQALAIDPGFGGARRMVGATLLKQGKFEEARWELSKLTEIEPRDARAHALYAQVLVGLGHIASAEAAAQRALALDPNNADAHRARGMILEKRGDFATAAEEFRAALRADQGSVDDRLSLVRTLMAANKLPDAELEVQSLEKLGPGRPEVAFIRGYLALRMGDPKAAVEYEDRALRLRPRYPQARMIRAEALFQMSQREEGRRELERFIDQATPALREDVARAKAFLQQM